MVEFLRILALYYACDGAATERPLAATDVAACMAHYRTVKSHFAAPDDSDAAAYMRFKSWERDNPAVVQEARRRDG